MTRIPDVFFEPEHFNVACNAVVPEYWGFVDARGGLQCHDTEAEARERAASAR